MRNALWLFLLALVLFSSPAYAQVKPYGAPIACNQSAYYDASSNGSTQLVALAAGQSIYVCGYTIVSGGTVNLKFVQGTGSNCGTNPATLTPAFSTIAQTIVSDSSVYWRGLKTSAGTALCFNASSGVAAQAIVYYSQF